MYRYRWRIEDGRTHDTPNGVLHSYVQGDFIARLELFFHEICLVWVIDRTNSMNNVRAVANKEDSGGEK